MIEGWDTCCEIALRRKSLDLTDDKSTLVQVMAWCHHATSHYLNQCWPRSCRHRASLGHNELMIGRVVLTLSCRQANFCLSTLQPWPWVKVTERSPSTFLPDLYFICPKYLWSSSNGFDVRSKSHCGGGGGKEMKTWSHPRLGWH